jgi:shikimate 5-dehydrogenase
VAGAQPADLLVNCTPVGGDLDPEGFKQLPVRADELAMFGCVIDFVYAEGETALVQSARSLGVPVVDGLDLLASQGALSFERFTGVPAPLEEMRAAARRG